MEGWSHAFNRNSNYLVAMLWATLVRSKPSNQECLDTTNGDMSSTATIVCRDCCLSPLR